MKTTFVNYKKYLIPALLLGSLAGGVALSPVGAAIAQGGASEARGWFHRTPSPETMQRMQEGQIAGAVAALKMSDEQLKLWAPIEKVIREQQAERLKMMQERMAAKAAGATPPAPATLADRLDKMADSIGKRAEHAKALAVAFKPFYATMSDAQKDVVGPLLARLSGGGRGGHDGHAWGDRKGSGHKGFGRGHQRMMGDGQGADAPPPAPAAPAQ